MSTLLTSVAAVEIEIKGALYAAEAIPAGEFGVSAVRLVKLVNGESYDVIRTHTNVVECSCPDFVCRHEGKGTMCKHGRAAVVEGLLPTAPAPIAGGSPAAEVSPPAAVAPITAKDRQRAAMWGLKLPAVPIVEAPALEVAPAIEPTANPRDSWGPETDADTWELGPEALASDDESTGLDLTAFASRLAAVGDEVASPVYTMPDLGGPVVVQPELVGLPPALPPMAWVEVGPRAYQMVNTTPDRTDYPRAARRGPFVPTAEEEAEAALLFADRRGSLLAGEGSPPIGDRAVPRRATAWPRRTFDEPRETDGYAPGYCS
jgi:hypothetical protein